MAGLIDDVEKQAAVTPHSETPTPEKICFSTKETGCGPACSETQSSIDIDPLSPLQHALAQPLAAAEVERSPSKNQEDDDEEEGEEEVNDSDPDRISRSSSNSDSNEDNKGPLHLTRTHASVTSTASGPPEFEVTIEADDPENPRNWPLWYRAYTVLSVSYATWVVVLYSTSYTAAIPGVMDEFGVSSRPVATLGLTTYLLGLAAGSVVVAPMSELYGRRVVYLVCLGIFVLLIIPCGLANSLAELIVIRFIGAVFGAAMISNSPGTVVDIAGHESLALCMSWYSIAPLNGPVTGPLIGGFVYENLGWRWGNWLAMILAGVAFLMLALVKETYMPALLKKKAARLRKETGDDRWWCRHDQRISTLDLLKVNLSRPFVLAATEPILWFFNIWISVIYGILYLCFVAYPIVFTQHRGWSVSMTGLAFVGIGIGTLLAIAMEPVWRRLINRSGRREPDTGRPAPEATALVMCIGAVLTPLGQLVFSWTCLPASIPAAVPIAFGIPFGMGNTLSFIYGSNYLAAAYGIYAASAMAGNAVIRSIFGAALPLAGPAMYEAMSPQWAGTFLGLLEVLLIPIPFAFYRYGHKIRDRSRVIRQMREDRAKAERRASRRKKNEMAAATTTTTKTALATATVTAAPPPPTTTTTSNATTTGAAAAATTTTPSTTITTIHTTAHSNFEVAPAVAVTARGNNGEEEKEHAAAQGARMT